MALIDRPIYVDRVLAYTDMPVVKVLTGMRRSGKSCLLELVADRLLSRGAPLSNVLHLRLDVLGTAMPRTGEELNDYILARLPKTGRAYIFLDEVQEVDEWERAVNSLIASRDVDIYLTGSNSRLLSSELATYIAGRYVSIDVSTLSFAEHRVFQTALGQPVESVAASFDNYQRRGGFPGLYTGDLADAQHYQAINDIYASALIRDVISRRQIRNADMLRRIAAFALENVGNPLSGSSISAYFKSQRRQVDTETVINYLDALGESFVLNAVPRYDLEGKKVLTINDKYFAGDHGLIHAMLGYSDRHLPGVLENIVWAELRRRGWTVRIGKTDGAEVDFVGDRDGARCYIQVTTSVLDPSTRERELAPLLQIKDSYPKLVLTLDASAGGNESGIDIRYLPDFLLDNA